MKDNRFDAIRSSFSRISSVLPLLLGAALICGCMAITLNYEVPATPISLGTAEEIPLKIELFLSEQLTNTTCPGNPGSIKIGAALGGNAEALARSLFTDVTVVRDPAAPTTPGLQARLTPDVLATARNRPKMGSSDQTSVVVLRWKLTTANEDLIWLDTITGEGVAPVIEADEQGRRMIEDLFQKSFVKIASAKEVRDFAAKQP